MKKYTIPIFARLCANMLSQALLVLMLLLGVQNAYALTPQEVSGLSGVFGVNASTPVNANTLNLFKSKHVVGNMLNTGQILEAPQALVSSNGVFYAGTNSDGQFTIINSNGQQVWLATTSAAQNGKVAMQGDGNLCLYPSGNAGQVWCSRSNGATGSYFAILRDTGVLEIYKGDPKNINPDNLVWTSLLDPVYYNNRYADLNNAYHGDWIQLMYHWITYGRYEARSPRAGISDDLYQKIRDVHLDPIYYVNKYPDVYREFGRDPAKLFGHWITSGIKEGRIPNSGIDNFIKDAPRDARGLHVMRVGDWLGNDTFMQSKNKQYIAVLMNDGPMEVFHTSSLQGISNGNRVFSQQGRLGKGLPDRLPVAQRFMTMQADGHFCTYEGTKQNAGNFVGCIPEGADDAVFPKGSYFVTLEDDGNLVIHRGPGPDDDRGYVWQSNSERMQPSKNWWEKAQADIGDVAVTVANGVTKTAFQVSTWATNTANSVANETVNAANTVAGVTVDAYNTVKDEVNKFINDPLGFIRNNCYKLADYFPSPLGNIDAANQALQLAQFSNEIYPNRPADETIACANAFNVGFVCQVPEEIVDTVNSLQKIPALLERANQSTNREECKNVAEKINSINSFFAPATNVMKQLGIPVPDWIGSISQRAQVSCGVTLMLATDAINMGKCTMAAAKNGVLEEMFDGEGSGSAIERKCRLAGKVSLKAAKKALLKDPSSATLKTAELLDSIASKSGSLNKLKQMSECNNDAPNPSSSNLASFTITAAWYGVENGVHLDNFNGITAVQKIGQTMKNGTILIPADMNSFFGVDPAPNKPKVVAVQVAINGKATDLRQKEGKALKYPGARGVDYLLPEDLIALDNPGFAIGGQPSTNTMAKSGKIVEVGRAWYGVESKPLWDINGKNIADTIRAANKDGNLLIPANMNAFFGMDPMPGIPKEVAVEIKYDGKVIYLRQSEGKALKFPGVEGVDYRIVR